MPARCLSPTALTATLTATLCLPLAGLPTTVDAADGLGQSLPADMHAVLQLRDPGAALRGMQQSAFLARLQATSAWQQWQSSREGQKAQQGLTVLRGATGKDPVELIESLLGEETVLAARPGAGKPEAVLLTRFGTPDQLRERLDKLRTEIQARFGFWPFREAGKHGDWALFEGLNMRYAEAGEILALSNNPILLDSVLTALPHAAGGPAEDGPLCSLRLQLDGTQLGGIPLRMNNFLPSLLAGQLTGALHNSEYVDLSLHRSDTGLRLFADIPKRGGTLPAHYGAYLPTATEDPLSGSLTGRPDLLSIDLHRDWADWWRQKEHFLDERGLHDLARLEEALALIFAGESWEDDVLPTFAPNMQLIVRNQDYDQVAANPALPAFALIATTDNPAHIGKRLRGGLQSIAGLINVNRAQKGMDDLFLVETERVGDGRVYTLIQDADQGDPAQATIEANFSVSFTMVGQRLIIASTRELAADLLQHVQDHGVQEHSAQTAGDAGSADHWRLDVGALADLARANRESLVSKQMLEGRDHEEADKRIHALLELLGLIRDVELTAAMRNGSYQVDVQVQAD